MSTIDYKALAERLEMHAECHANVEPHDDEQRQWAADLRTVVSLLEGMVEETPIYAYEWDTYDGAVRRSFSPAQYNGREPTRTLMLYLHPAPQPQPEPTPDYTLCWCCGEAYPMTHLTCAKCGSLNANHDPEGAAAEMQKAAQPQPERQPVSEPTEVQTCLWWRDGDEDSDTWGTSCGNFFTLNEGTPTENKIAFCHHCGKRVEDDAALAARETK